MKYIILLLPFMALFTAHLIWGVNFLVAKLTLQEIPTMSLGFLRFSIALLFLIPFLIAEKKKISINVKDLPRLFMAGICMTTINIALFYEGISKTTTTNASVLTLIVPGVSVLLGWRFLKEKVYVINIIGILMGLLGALVIIGLPLIALNALDSEALLGNILFILGSISWVIGLLLSKELMKKYSTLVITTFCFLVGTVTFLIPAATEYFANPGWPAEVTPLGGLGLMYIAILSSVCAFFLTEWGVRKMTLAKANTIQYIEPLIATTLGVMVLNERISYSFIVGSIMIGLGVYWGTLGKESHHKTFKAHRH